MLIVVKSNAAHGQSYVRLELRPDSKNRLLGDRYSFRSLTKVKVVGKRFGDEGCQHGIGQRLQPAVSKWTVAGAAFQAGNVVLAGRAGRTVSSCDGAGVNAHPAKIGGGQCGEKREPAHQPENG